MRFISILLIWLSTSLSTSHAAMSTEYAIVFIMQSSCHWCHQIAPSVKKTSKALNLPIYTFTLDGGGIPEFQVPIPATQKIRDEFLVQTKVVPATYLINVNSRKFTRITEGIADYPTLYNGFSNALNDPEVREALR